MKKHAVYLTVDELTDIIIAYDGSIVLLKENRRAMKEPFMKKNFPHMVGYYDEHIKKNEEMMKKLIEIRNNLQKIEREEN